MSFHCGFSIGLENINWFRNLRVYFLDEGFDWFGEDLPLRSSKWAMVSRGKVVDALCALLLFELTGR